jgi:hypothetical protein
MGRREQRRRRLRPEVCGAELRANSYVGIGRVRCRNDLASRSGGHGRYRSWLGGSGPVV